MKPTAKTPTAPGEETQAAPFKGYTIEEIRYQRALAGLRKEFCKAKLVDTLDSIRFRKPAQQAKPAGKMAIAAKAGKIAMKLLGNMNTLDYVLMGISLFGTARKGIKLLRGRKK